MLNFVVFTFSDLIDILIQAQATVLWVFLDTSIKFDSTLSIQIGSLLIELTLTIEISRGRQYIYIYSPWCIFISVSQIETTRFQNNVFLGNRHLRGGGPDPGPASVRYGTLAYLTLIVFPRAERDTSGIIPNLRTSPSVRRFAPPWQSISWWFTHLTALCH